MRKGADPGRGCHKLARRHVLDSAGVRATTLRTRTSTRAQAKAQLPLKI